MACHRLVLGWLFVLLFPALVCSQASPNKDQYGDPLPPGAIARLGTLHWRHEGAIGFAAFLPGGKSVLSVGADQTIRIWEFPSGKEIRRITLVTMDNEPRLPGRVGAPGVRTALREDGKVIATYVNAFSKIRLHDVDTGKELPSLEVKDSAVNKLFFSPNHAHLMSTDFDGMIHVWDWANGKELRKFPAPGGGGPQPAVNVHEESLVVSPDGNTMMHVGPTNAANSSGPRYMRDTHALGFIDVRTGKEIGPAGHTVPLVSVKFSADGEQVITQADDSSTLRWDARTGKELGAVKLPADIPKGPLRQTRNVVVSPDGQVAAVLSSKIGGPILNLVDTKSGKTLSALSLTRRGAGQPTPLLFGPENKLLAVIYSIRPSGVIAKGDNDPTIELFDVATGKLLQTFTVKMEASKTGNFAGARVSQTGFFSPDGKTLAWSVDGKTLSLWDTVTGRNTQSLTPPNNAAMEGASFTPDGRCLAMEMNGGGAMLFELAIGAPRRLFGKSEPSKMPGPGLVTFGGAAMMSIKPTASSRIAVSPNGKSLALAGPDQVLRVWDIATGTELAAFKNAQSKLTAAAFSPDNATLATACADTTALVWDLTRVARPVTTVEVSKPADLEECWQALAGIDGERAFRAICDLTAMPKETVAFLKDKLKPAQPVDLKRAQELIGQLDHDQYKVREKATMELNKMGEQIVPQLDKALAGNPSLETKLRLDEMRGRMNAMLLKGDRLRFFRAVEVLERIGTPESRQILQGLAAGEPGVLLTTSARAALDR